MRSELSVEQNMKWEWFHEIAKNFTNYSQNSQEFYKIFHKIAKELYEPYKFHKTFPKFFTGTKNFRNSWIILHSWQPCSIAFMGKAVTFLAACISLGRNFDENLENSGHSEEKCWPSTG